jgi:capsular exopolysaccharide synthesis family protein
VTAREYIDIARDRWRSVLAGLLLGLMAAVAAVYLVPRQYAVPVTMMVSAQPAGDPTTGSNPDVISDQRLYAYIELLQSRGLARDVIATLQLDTTPEELGDQIAVTTAPESVLLTATITSGSPAQAVRIANAVADQFIRDVAKLEEPADRTRPPAVTAEVFQEAELPAEQVAPRPVLYVALGAVLGLVVGLASALLGHALDSRIKSRRQLEETLGAPVLGTIGRDPKIPSSPLVMFRAPHTQLAEAFRQLRTNVQFMDIDRQHKVLLITSANSGEGRSTTVCNLGLALAEAGTRVLIIDADLRSPTIARLLRVDNTVGLTDVLVNRVSVERVLQPIGPTLDVLPSGWTPPNPSELLGSSRMASLLATLRTAYDVVLIDAAPLLPVTDAAVLAPRADGVLVLVRHGRTQVQDVQAAKDALRAVSGRILGSVVTIVSQTRSRTQTRLEASSEWRQRLPSKPLVAPQPPREQGSGRRAGRVSAPASASQPPSAPAPSADPCPGPHDGASQATPGPRPSEPSDANGQVLDHRGPAAR